MVNRYEIIEIPPGHFPAHGTVINSRSVHIRLLLKKRKIMEELL